MYYTLPWWIGKTLICCSIEPSITEKKCECMFVSAVQPRDNITEWTLVGGKKHPERSQLAFSNWMEQQKISADLNSVADMEMFSEVRVLRSLRTTFSALSCPVLVLFIYLCARPVMFSARNLIHEVVSSFRRSCQMSEILSRKVRILSLICFVSRTKYSCLEVENVK